MSRSVLFVAVSLLAACASSEPREGSRDPAVDPTVPPETPACVAATEVPYDGVDQDCDGADLVDVDADGVVAEQADGEDCDDGDADTWPGADDVVGDGVDQGCDGVDGVDGDLDGSASLQSGGTDCDDLDPATSPTASEIWYDGFDQDCDRACDFDQDGDGAVLDGYDPVDGSACDAMAQNGVVQDVRDCDDVDAAVSNRLLVGSPGAYELGVEPLASVSVTFDGAEPGAAITLDGPAGPVAGSADWEGTSLVWTPFAPLVAATTYTATVSWSCGPEAWTFTTEAPLDDQLLPNRTWALELAAGDWVEPAGLGPLLAGVVSTELLLEVLTATPTELTVRLGMSADGVVPTAQDPCVATSDQVADFTANPLVQIGPFDLTVDLAGLAAGLDDATLVGEFSGDASLLEEVTLAASLDTRPLLPLIGGAQPGDVCALVAAFGVSCIACPDGAPYCLDVRVEDLTGVEVVGLALDARTTADIAADPACP